MRFLVLYFAILAIAVCQVKAYTGDINYVKGRRPINLNSVSERRRFSQYSMWSPQTSPNQDYFWSQQSSPNQYYPDNRQNNWQSPSWLYGNQPMPYTYTGNQQSVTPDISSLLANILITAGLGGNGANMGAGQGIGGYYPGNRQDGSNQYYPSSWQNNWQYPTWQYGSQPMPYRYSIQQSVTPDISTLLASIFNTAGLGGNDGDYYPGNRQDGSNQYYPSWQYNSQPLSYTYNNQQFMNSLPQSLSDILGSVQYGGMLGKTLGNVKTLGTVSDTLNRLLGSSLGGITDDLGGITDPLSGIFGNVFGDQNDQGDYSDY